MGILIKHERFFSTTLADETIISESTEVNTDIGYDKEELNNTTTEDLLILKRAIYSYLKSPNLKKRNPNYMKLFKRINEELKRRKGTQEEKKTILHKFSFDKTDLKFKDEIKENKENIEFLNRKRSCEVKKPNLAIPEFLQDKSKEKEFDISIILDNKIEALKSFGEKDSKKNYVSTRVKEFIEEDTDFSLIKNSSVIDKELKDIEMSLVMTENIEYDPNFI